MQKVISSFLLTKTGPIFGCIRSDRKFTYMTDLLGSILHPWKACLLFSNDRMVTTFSIVSSTYPLFAKHNGHLVSVSTCLLTYYANVFAHTTYCAQDLHNQYLTLHVCGMSKINHNDKQTSHLIDNSIKKRASRASALHTDETQHARGLVLTPWTSPTP